LSVSSPHHALHEDSQNAAAIGASARRSAETKTAHRTTEFAVYLVAVVSVLIASYLAGDPDGRGDVFRADKAWFYVTLLTIGYMVSRGLAKAGSSEHRDACARAHRVTALSWAAPASTEMATRR
jgi:hypothetical protein